MPNRVRGNCDVGEQVGLLSSDQGRCAASESGECRLWAGGEETQLSGEPIGAGERQQCSPPPTPATRNMQRRLPVRRVPSTMSAA